MEILELSHFASANLRSLVEEEVSVWRRTLHWDYSCLAEMILRFADSHILPGFAAVEAGRVHGYSFFLTEGAKGGIGDLYVEDSAATRGRRHEIEIDLLRRSIGMLQRASGVHRVEAQLIIHPTDHLAKPFLEEGFRRFRRLFLTLPIERAQSSPSRPLSSDTEIHRWTEADYEPAANIITSAYQGHVDSVVGDQYRTLSGSLAFLNNIVRFPTCGVFDASASYVAVHRPTQTPISVLLCSSLRSDVGHITQVCTLPEYRSSGVGEHLYCRCYADLAARGFTEVSLTVTEENDRAVALYRRLGFQHLHTFDAFVWEG